MTPVLTEDKVVNLSSTSAADPPGSVTTPGAPKRILSTRDGLVMVVGLVVGAGIFRTPPLVAGSVSSEWIFLSVWVLGGIVALIGALCYAELASTYPNAGGEYHILHRSFGSKVSFLLGWSRLAVIQTGSIAMLGYLFADYAVRFLPFTSPVATALATPVLASLLIITLTFVNASGLHPGRKVQYLFTAGEFAGLGAIIAAGIIAAIYFPSPPVDPASQGVSGLSSTVTNLGLAMVFVLLTYGGWSEAAYLSAELKDRRKGVHRTLLGGVAAITLIYLLTNTAYLFALGLPGIAASDAVAVDVMNIVTGKWGGIVVGIIVIMAAVSSLNATIITGARGSFAIGRDIGPLHALGVWRLTKEDDSGAPRRALIVQAAVALLLVAFGAAARSGFESMVAYTAPVFWLTLFLMGIALFVLRNREPNRDRPFSVPLYPLTPALFCATSAAMFYSSVMYAGTGALFGVAVMLAGIPILLWGRSRAINSEISSDASISPSNTTV